MTKFEEKKFTIPALTGISAKTIEEHLKLYAGYVKNANSIIENAPEHMKYAEKNPFANYLVGELGRRFSFEYNGMRNHEIYFSSFEGGPKQLADKSPLKEAIETYFDSFDEFLKIFKNILGSYICIF